MFWQTSDLLILCLTEYLGLYMIPTTWFTQTWRSILRPPSNSTLDTPMLWWQDHGNDLHGGQGTNGSNGKKEFWLCGPAVHGKIAFWSLLRAQKQTIWVPPGCNKFLPRINATTSSAAFTSHLLAHRGWRASSKNKSPIRLRANSFKVDSTPLSWGLWCYFRSQILRKCHLQVVI